MVAKLGVMTTTSFAVEENSSGAAGFSRAASVL